MDVKSQVITEINTLLSEYQEKKDDIQDVPYDEAKHHANLGAVEALEFLKSGVENIDVNGYNTMRIVEESSSDFQTLRPATGFLSQVLLRIESTLKDKRIYGHPGSGANPKAIPGRKEACMRIKRYVYELHDELTDDQ